MFGFWSQEEVEKKSRALLELGLLFETGFDDPHVKGSSTFMSFQHKSFQEYTSGYFIKKRLEKTDNKKVGSCYFIVRFYFFKIFCGCENDHKMLSKSLCRNLLHFISRFSCQMMADLIGN